jgi:hypothetical protein
MQCPLNSLFSKVNMKRRFFVLLGVSGLLLLRAYPAAPVATSTSSVLQRDVTNTVMMADMAIFPECKQRKVLNMEIVEVSSDGKSGVERWTIERCGMLVAYRITLSPSLRGGTDFSVKFEK